MSNTRTTPKEIKALLARVEAVLEDPDLEGATEELLEDVRATREDLEEEEDG